MSSETRKRRLRIGGGALLGLAGGIVLLQQAPWFGSRRHRESIAKAEVMAICQAIQEFQVAKNGRLPNNIDALLVCHSGCCPGSQPVPLDPWGKPYWYQPNPDGISFTVGTYGADGRPGGEGEHADITNETIADERVGRRLRSLRDLPPGAVRKGGYSPTSTTSFPS